MKKGFAHIILLIIIVLVGIAAVGYFAFQNGQVKTNSNQSQDLATPSPEAISITPNSDPTNDWKLYINNSANYSVKYPSDWKVENVAAGSFGSDALLESRFISIYNQPDKTQAVGSLNIEKLDLIPSSEESTLNEKMVIGQNTARCKSDHSKKWCWLQIPNTQSYLNFLLIKANDKDYNQTLDQILSTFKFND